MESWYIRGVFLTRKNHSKYTGAFHAREGYQKTGFEATEEGISQLAPVAQIHYRTLLNRVSTDGVKGNFIRQTPFQQVVEKSQPELE
jgi:hypothetical protein